MKQKLVINYDGLIDSAYLTKLKAISSAMIGNPHFPNDMWPGIAPSLDQFNETVNKFEAAYLAALGGDKQKIQQRKNARSEANDLIEQVGYVILLSTRGDVEKMMTTGYDLRKEGITTVSTAPLGSPQNLTLKHGPHKGTMIGKASRLVGARSYELQMTTADPTVEDNWKYVGPYVNCSHLEISGLTPGVQYSFRLRGVGASGPGPWSGHFELMAI